MTTAEQSLARSWSRTERARGARRAYKEGVWGTKSSGTDNRSTGSKVSAPGTGSPGKGRGGSRGQRGGAGSPGGHGGIGHAHEGAIIANGQVYEAGPNEVPVMARNGEAIIPFSKMNKQGNGLTVNFNIDGNLIADEATFDKFVYKIDKKLNEINQRYYS